ncbi:MAG TPA: MerR family transcriptional regulator [Xanthobacteraceae bacterium]
MDKAPDAFRTISEVAEEVNVPQHVLRFWESRFSQIRPLKRGGGRRYYRPDDIDLLRGVRHLLYGEGYTIRGVQRILREQGLAFVQGVWRVDAQAPPPDVDDAEDEDESTPVMREEPRFFAKPPGLSTPPPQHAPAIRQEPVLPAPAPPQQSPAPPAHAADQQDREKLRAVLDELTECRRVLDAAMAAAAPA